MSHNHPSGFPCPRPDGHSGPHSFICGKGCTGYHPAEPQKTAGGKPVCPRLMDGNEGSRLLRAQVRSPESKNEVILPKGRCLTWGCGKELKVRASNLNGKVRYRVEGARGMCDRCYQAAKCSGDLVKWHAPRGTEKPMCEGCGEKQAIWRVGAKTGRPGPNLCRSCYDKNRWHNHPDRESIMARNREASRRARRKRREQAMTKE